MGNVKVTIWEFLLGAMSQPSFAVTVGVLLSAMLAIAYFIDATRSVFARAGVDKTLREVDELFT